MQTNGHYYYSLRFIHDTGIARYKTLTDKIRSILPRALVGANYSPTGYAIGPADGQQYCHAYLGIVFQWIELFRKGGMTMPWSEDWAWQTPIGSKNASIFAPFFINVKFIILPRQARDRQRKN